MAWLAFGACTCLMLHKFMHLPTGASQALLRTREENQGGYVG
jgi:hypothetical protein